MLEIIYAVCSFATFFGVAFLWGSIYKSFSKLKTSQKVSLIIITVGSVIPVILGTIQGMTQK